MKVILTFDVEGDLKIDRVILRILEKYDLPAIFFLEGRWIERFPKDARQISKKFLIGNHSYSHLYFKNLHAKQQEAEIQKCDKLLNRLARNSNKKIFRAPFTKSDSRLFFILKKNNYHYDSSVVKYVCKNPGKFHGIKEFFVNIPSDYDLFVRCKLHEQSAFKLVNSFFNFQTFFKNIAVLDLHPTYKWGIKSYPEFFDKICSTINKKFEPTTI